MTLREAFQGLLDLFFNSFASFVDAQEKLFSGNILDLTIGQTISLFFSLVIYFNLLSENKSQLPKNEDRPPEDRPPEDRPPSKRFVIIMSTLSIIFTAYALVLFSQGLIITALFCMVPVFNMVFRTSFIRDLLVLIWQKVKRSPLYKWHTRRETL
mgnify:CR=1 FL=1